MTPPDTAWFKINDIAAMCGVARRTVVRWIDAGEIDVVKVGTVVRITPDAFEDFKRRRQTPAVANRRRPGRKPRPRPADADERNAS